MQVIRVHIWTIRTTLV